MKEYRISKYMQSLGVMSADSNIYEVHPLNELCIITPSNITEIVNVFVTVACRLGLQS